MPALLLVPYIMSNGKVTENGVAMRKGITGVIEINRTTSYNHICLRYVFRDRMEKELVF